MVLALLFDELLEELEVVPVAAAARLLVGVPVWVAMLMAAMALSPSRAAPEIRPRLRLLATALTLRLELSKG